MNTDEFKKIIDEHQLWLQNKVGQRANLSRANLSYANLRRADLRRADLSRANLSWANLSWAILSGANLSGANLSGANLLGADLSGADLDGADLSLVYGINYAQCAFRGHGEHGRQLLAVIINDTTMFFCGCFNGDENSLRQYIQNGDRKLKKSRLLALEFCINALEFHK